MAARKMAVVIYLNPDEYEYKEKHYKNFSATVRKWIDEDMQKRD